MDKMLAEGQILTPRAGAAVLPVIAGRAVVLVELFDDGAWGCDVIDRELPLYPLAWIELDPCQLEWNFVPEGQIYE